MVKGRIYKCDQSDLRKRKSQLFALFYNWKRAVANLLDIGDKKEQTGEKLAFIVVILFACSFCFLLVGLCYLYQ